MLGYMTNPRVNPEVSLATSQHSVDIGYALSVSAELDMEVKDGGSWGFDFGGDGPIRPAHRAYLIGVKWPILGFSKGLLIDPGIYTVSLEVREKPNKDATAAHQSSNSCDLAFLIPPAFPLHSHQRQLREFLANAESFVRPSSCEAELIAGWKPLLDRADHGWSVVGVHVGHDAAISIVQDGNVAVMLFVVLSSLRTRKASLRPFLRRTPSRHSTP